MVDRNGKPILDGARVKATIPTANVGIVQGPAVVDFKDYTSEGEMVAITFDSGVEAYCKASYCEVIA